MTRIVIELPRYVHDQIPDASDVIISLLSTYDETPIPLPPIATPCDMARVGKHISAERYDQLTSLAAKSGLDVSGMILSYLLSTYDISEPTATGVVFDVDRLEDLLDNVRDKVSNREGWVSWRDLRPAHRDREVYEERLWVRMTEEDELETDEETRGRVKIRRVRASR